jgi:DMSO/TMAO reductase YedYZ molybdopterin-dependent catalytic subunit
MAAMNEIERGPEPPPPPRRPRPGDLLAERPEIAIEIPRSRLAAQSRRDFLLFAAGILTAGAGAWWLLPDRARARLFPGPERDRLDTLAARVGLSRASRERALDGALTFDDDVAEALYSRNRRMRTYPRSAVTPLRNNYNGRTPDPRYLSSWSLQVSGLASGRIEHLTADQLASGFTLREQITRLCCVEGWSAVAWWDGIRFADLLAAFPPAPGARWAALRSSVNLDAAGRPDPYYVSIDLETARHPQTLLATRFGGRPLTVEHGAPLRLLAPMKLGLKNIKAVTEIAYSANEPPDYWNERGYSKYDGL